MDRHRSQFDLRGVRAGGRGSYHRPFFLKVVGLELSHEYPLYGVLDRVLELFKKQTDQPISTGPDYIPELFCQEY